MTPWIYKNQPVEALPESCVGFVYLITNLTNGRLYVGKKLTQHSKIRYQMVQLKNGTKKRKRIRELVESDWRTYWGSSTELTRDIAILGPRHFRREILHYCDSKGQTSYMEAREQFMRGVLLDPLYYNNQIQCRISKKHLIKST